MSTKSNSGSVPWVIAGVAFLVLLVVAAWLFRQDGGPTRKLASKASRVDLVGRIQLDLVTAAEAEKSSVLAITDEESEKFADQARAATALVDRERQDLGALLSPDAFQRERDLLSQFSEAFNNLKRVDREVLALAVKNTNLKAYSLLFGPAADTLAEFDTALDRVTAKYADSADGKRVMLASYSARVGMLRIQALLAPHIAEESDPKMDQMEAVMAEEETKARKNLDVLGGLVKVAGDEDLAVALARFDKYRELKARILLLSRENTNVRSLALSLNQKRKAMILCLDVLGALKQAIFDEPIAGVTYGRPERPR
jgi:hypothetical protein